MNRLVIPLALVGLFAATQADARPFRVSQIPNAPAGCGTCHVSVGGGGARNAFGQDVEATLVGTPIFSADVDWSAIYNTDSDGDGFTNGEELGDPNGNWSIGSASPSGPTYEPGNASDLPDCGNNVIDAVNGEDCDGTDLDGETCVSQGFVQGTLACDSQCAFDTSACSNSMPDAGPTDATPADSGPMDATPADAGPTMDATPADSVDSGNPDATPADSGTMDATPVDSGDPDATPADSGTMDATPVDSGDPDATPVDGGTMDATPVDSGDPDATPADSGNGAADAGADDTGTNPGDGDDDDDSGCQAVAGSTWGLWGLVALVPVLRRRRRR
jgi:hypothetical protein